MKPTVIAALICFVTSSRGSERSIIGISELSGAMVWVYKDGGNHKAGNAKVIWSAAVFLISGPAR